MLASSQFVHVVYMLHGNERVNRVDGFHFLEQQKKLFSFIHPFAPQILAKYFQFFSSISTNFITKVFAKKKRIGFFYLLYNENASRRRRRHFHSVRTSNLKKNTQNFYIHESVCVKASQ